MPDWVQRYYEQKRVEQDQKGGPGSGHHGHAGRPGKRGGSLPGKGDDGTPILPFNKPSQDPTKDYDIHDMTREEFKYRWTQSAQTDMGVPILELSKAEQENWVGYQGGETLRVYRGAKRQRDLEPGDYVTTSPEYAKVYGEHVVGMDVPVKYLHYFTGSIHGDPGNLDVGTMPELIFVPIKTKFHKRYHSYDWDKLHRGDK